MWLSKKIRKDSDAKETLKALKGLIKDYSDATNIVKPKFWSIDTGKFFRPKVSKYIVVVFVLTVVLWFAKTNINVLQGWVNTSLRISVPIFVIGITLSTVVKKLDNESRFAIDYLKDSCRMVKFAGLAFFTVLAGFLSVEVYGFINSYLLYFLFATAIGGTIWCLTSLLYIIVETTRCMHPDFSTKAASNYAARKLLYGFMKDAYRGVWDGKRIEILEQELKDCENIEYPWYGHWYSSKESENRYVIPLPKNKDNNPVYRDYNVEKLKEVNKQLGNNNAVLRLSCEVLDPDELGEIYCEEGGEEFVKSITKQEICRFGKHAYIKETKDFWDDNYLKLRKSLLKAIKAEDLPQFREYLKSIENIFDNIRKVRKSTLVRVHTRQDRYRFLSLYSKSIKWLLEAGTEEEVCHFFIIEVKNSIENQAENDIKKGDWYVIDTFKWVFPDAYRAFENYRDTPLWEERAKIGRFYYYADKILRKYQDIISEDEKLQIQLVLYTGITSWLIVAEEKEDNELVKDLCEAARRLVLPQKRFDAPRELMGRHFILCGKMLKRMNETDSRIYEDAFNLLQFGEYEMNRQLVYTFDELVDLYLEIGKLDLREYSRDFSETDWEMGPLAGMGTGTPSYYFDGDEFDYMFIYLALWKIDSERWRPVKFSQYRIRSMVSDFENILGNNRIPHFQQAKERLEKWMDACDKKYEQQKKQGIIDTPMDSGQIKQFKDSFAEDFSNSPTFLTFCIKSGHYTIERGCSRRLKFKELKSLFLEDSESSVDYWARYYGNSFARNSANKYVNSILDDNGISNAEAVHSMETLLERAVQWFKDKGVSPEDGVIVFRGDMIIDRMYNNEYYIPRWKKGEENCFYGYYKNYPILRVPSRESNECFALNLEGWKGLRVNPEIDGDQLLGEIDVKEIEGSDKCNIEYELLWDIKENDLPEQAWFKLADEDGEKGD